MKRFLITLVVAIVVPRTFALGDIVPPQGSQPPAFSGATSMSNEPQNLLSDQRRFESYFVVDSPRSDTYVETQEASYFAPGEYGSGEVAFTQAGMFTSLIDPLALDGGGAGGGRTASVVSPVLPDDPAISDDNKGERTPTVPAPGAAVLGLLGVSSIAILRRFQS